MLSGREIRELIAAGHLRVEPILDDFQIGACSFDVRVGRSVQLDASSTSPLNIEIGDAVRLEPRAYIRFVTLETLEFPDGISGMVFLWSGFASIGLVMQPSRIDPGWSGKLVLGMVNLSSAPVEIVSGQRIASISLFKLEMASPKDASLPSVSRILDTMIDAGVLSPELHFDSRSGVVTRSFRTGEHTSLKNAIRLITTRTQQKYNTNQEPATSLFERVFSETDSQRKGEALEDFVEAILQGVLGLKIIRRNARLQAEELDFIIQNHVENAFLRTLGSPMVIECKNWSRPVGAAEINLIAAKMEALSPDVKGGILIAPNGVSGDAQRDAQLRRREFRQKGRYIVVLDRGDLKRIADGNPLVQVVEEKYSELYLI